jgi:hypothetical protein
MTAYILKKTPPGTTWTTGTVFEGEAVPAGKVKRTDVDPPVVIPFGHADPLLGDVPPITGLDDKIRFCTNATIFARQEKTDRDYLIAVAFYASDNLGKFGQATDSRIGPFKFTVKEWIEATASFNAPAVQFPVTDVFQWNRQIIPAARQAAEKTKVFKDAHGGERPDPVQLYFYERMGAAAADFLKLAKDKPTTKCETIDLPAPAGSFLAEVKKAQAGKEIDAFLDGVKEGLMAGFADSRAIVSSLPPHLRYFNDEDFAPWLAVARLLGIGDLPTSTDKFSALFKSVIAVAPSSPATFVAFCMAFCGDPAAKANQPPNNVQDAASWKGWGKKSSDPAPAGSVVMTKDSIPEGIGILAETATADPVAVYFCTKDAAGVVKVEKRQIAKADIVDYRWLDLSTANGLRLPGADDSLFVEKAPKVMADLLHDYPMLKDFQAAAILGNIGHECMGFRALQEIKPTGKDGRGGLGWCQWTDGRRTNFEAFAAGNGGVTSDTANYGFLKKELTEHPDVIEHLSQASNLRSAVERFERDFENANIQTVNYDERERYAGIALALHTKTIDLSA